MSCCWKAKCYCLGFFSLPLWKVFSFCPYLDPAFCNYFCHVKGKFPNPCSQKLLKVPKPWAEQPLAAGNGVNLPHFQTYWLVLYFYPFTQHIIQLRVTPWILKISILPLWSHIVLSPEARIAFTCNSALPNSCQWRIVISFVWVHLFRILSPVAESLPLQQTLFFF